MSDLVCIVTNSPPCWVQSSCCRFLPNLAIILKDNRVGILSAKGVYQPLLPGQPLAWKHQAFGWLCRYATEQLALDIGSLTVIGDSDCEMQAGRQVSRSLGMNSYKQVKVHRASAFMIAKQLICLKHQLSSIIRSSEDKEVLLIGQQL